MKAALQVEWRWVPVSESENAERCQRLRELLLRGARRLSQSGRPNSGLEASVGIEQPKMNFQISCGVLPVVRELTPT